MNELDLLSKRLDKLEDALLDNQKTLKADMKELSTELKTAIKQGFVECRIIAPLTCPNSRKLSLTQAIGLCTVVIGVFLTLAKLGLLSGLMVAAGG